MKNKELLNESLNKIHSMMNFKPGMTKTELREILEKGLKAEAQESTEDLPKIKEVAEEDVDEVDVEVAETKEEVAEEDVTEEDEKEDEKEDKDEKKGATNMAVGFVNESISNKERKRINKEARLNKKFGITL